MSRVYRALEKAEKEKQQKQAQRTADQLFEPPLPPREEAPPAESPPIARPEPKEAGLALPEREEMPILIAPPNSFAAEQFRKLRTHIFFHEPRPPRVILVTSTAPQEGKTMVAMNLALSISQEMSRKAVLIDADLRMPSLLLEKHKNRGLSTYLSDHLALQDILLDSGAENLKLIPGGPPSPRSPELIGSPRMEELLAILRALGEDTYVVIDSPPILSTTEPTLLSRLVDGVILVVMADRTPKKAIRRALECIDRQKVLGVVFNQMDLGISHYGSEYYYERK